MFSLRARGKRKSSRRANSKQKNKNLTVRATHEEEANSPREFRLRRGKELAASHSHRAASSERNAVSESLFAAAAGRHGFEKHDAMIVQVPGASALTAPPRRAADVVVAVAAATRVICPCSLLFVFILFGLFLSRVRVCMCIARSSTDTHDSPESVTDKVLPFFFLSSPARNHG